MPYADLFPVLIAKGHIQTRTALAVPDNPPHWYKSDQFCAYHQGGPRHNIENYLSFNQMYKGSSEAEFYLSEIRIRMFKQIRFRNMKRLQ